MPHGEESILVAMVLGLLCLLVLNVSLEDPVSFDTFGGVACGPTAANRPGRESERHHHFHTCII